MTCSSPDSHRLTGLTPVELVLGAKLARSARALATTNAPVTEIARSEGYHRLSSFDHAFGRVFVVGPTVYRSSTFGPMAPSDDSARSPPTDGGQKP